MGCRGQRLQTLFNWFLCECKCWKLVQDGELRDFLNLTTRCCIESQRGFSQLFVNSAHLTKSYNSNPNVVLSHVTIFRCLIILPKISSSTKCVVCLTNQRNHLLRMYFVNKKVSWTYSFSQNNNFNTIECHIVSHS